MPYYYVYPFGVNADDLTAIPTAAAVDGSVSYQDGWTIPYQYDLETNPSALPIPRGQMNELFLQITENIQQYQQFGTPAWITAADNLGTPYPYAINARVYYAGSVYESLVSSNTSTPGTDANWAEISGGSGAIPIGGILDFPSPVVPSNYLLCDGATPSRATYPALYNAITFTQAGSLTNASTTVTGLTNATSYMYAGMPVEGSGVPASTTIASITNATTIELSNAATASGTATIRFFPNGNGDGSTTFTLPDRRRRVPMGSGGTASTDPLGVGNVSGQVGGEESHAQTVAELAVHDHAPQVGGFLCTGGGTEQGNPGGQYSSRSATANTGSGTAFNIIQPSAITTFAIRYA